MLLFLLPLSFQIITMIVIFHVRKLRTQQIKQLVPSPTSTFESRMLSLQNHRGRGWGRGAWQVP